MANYDINVNVKSQTTGRGGSAGGGGPGLSREDIRMRQQQTQGIKNATQSDARRDPNFKVNQQLLRTITKLDKNILKLNESVLRLDRTNKSQARRGGGGGGPGGGTSAGSVGASIPILGAAVAAFGFAMSKVMQVGRANLATRMQQKQTAGVAGFQSSGQQLDVFSAGEFGQYVKERRLQSGSFNTGNDYGDVSSNVAKSKNMSFQHMAMFGTSPVEMGKTVGALDVMTGNKGEAGLNEVIKNLYRKEGGKVKGPGTQEGVILQQISSQIQEAVTAGVIDANIAKDMAREYSQFARVADPGQAKFILEAQKSMMNVQSGISKGQVGGHASFVTRMVTRDLISGKGAASDKIREQLMKSGRFDAGTDFTNLPQEEMETAIQVVNQNKSKEVRDAVGQHLYKTYGQQGYHHYKKAVMNLTPDFAGDEATTFLRFKKAQSGPGEQATDEEITAKRVGHLAAGANVRAATAGTGRIEKLQLGPVGESAANATLKVDAAMIRFANTMSDDVTAGIGKFTDGIELAATGIEKFVGIIQGFVAKKTPEQMKDIYSGSGTMGYTADSIETGK